MTSPPDFSETTSECTGNQNNEIKPYRLCFSSMAWDLQNQHQRPYVFAFVYKVHSICLLSCLLFNVFIWKKDFLLKEHSIVCISAPMIINKTVLLCIASKDFGDTLHEGREQNARRGLNYFFVMLFRHAFFESHIVFSPPPISPRRVRMRHLLYGSVSQGLGTTKFTNLIGWNRYWPRSRFSHLDW